MIELKNLTKSFTIDGGEVHALQDINLTIEDGAIYGIIGMSGAGKSTLVRCSNMLERCWSLWACRIRPRHFRPS